MDEVIDRHLCDSSSVKTPRLLVPQTSDLRYNQVLKLAVVWIETTLLIQFKPMYL